MDNRLRILAHILLDHSLQIIKGDHFLIEAPTSAKPLILEIVNYANEIEANAFIKLIDEDILKVQMQGINKEFVKFQNKIDSLKYENMKGLIKIRSSQTDLSSVDSSILSMMNNINKDLNQKIINELAWVLLEWPSETAAKKANMIYEDYYNYFLDVSTLNYEKLGKNALPLKRLMEKTNKVHIVGEGTDLTFSIKDCPVIICDGRRNIPDGEVYVGPVKNSINGKITYNVKSYFQGKEFNNICFEFKDGKIIKAEALNYSKALNKILDIDEGARYIGEFAISFNNSINKPVGNILFDEKMAGSFHLTPGACYKDSNNGNTSSIHWDLVSCQKDGGQIYFDDILIRENGIFVLEELKDLN